MDTATVAKNQSDADGSTVAAALWVLAAVAWFVMAVLFVRHGLFSAVLLLLIALICLPGIRAAFRQQTGVRIPGMATGAAILALAAGSLAMASRNIEMRPSIQQAPMATGRGTADPVPSAHLPGVVRSGTFRQPSSRSDKPVDPRRMQDGNDVRL